MVTPADIRALAPPPISGGPIPDGLDDIAPPSRVVV
jgi:hypothetical protein